MKLADVKRVQVSTFRLNLLGNDLSKLFMSCNGCPYLNSCAYMVPLLHSVSACFFCLNSLAYTVLCVQILGLTCVDGDICLNWSTLWSVFGASVSICR